MIAAGDRRPERRPDPNTRPCDRCGHVWFAGERGHAYVDDEQTERPEDAAVLCSLCRRRRALPRR